MVLTAAAAKWQISKVSGKERGERIDRHGKNASDLRQEDSKCKSRFKYVHIVNKKSTSLIQLRNSCTYDGHGTLAAPDPPEATAGGSVSAVCGSICKEQGAAACGGKCPRLYTTGTSDPWWVCSGVKSWPQDTTCEVWKNLLDNFGPATSTACRGLGLYVLRQMVRRGTVVGFYGGNLDDRMTAYTASFRGGVLIDGTPTTRPDFTRFGYVNEFIWDEARNNLKLGYDGIITAIKDICPGEECFLSYGDYYDHHDHGWKAYKAEPLGKLCENCVRRPESWAKRT